MTKPLNTVAVDVRIADAIRFLDGGARHDVREQVAKGLKEIADSYRLLSDRQRFFANGQYCRVEELHADDWTQRAIAATLQTVRLLALEKFRTMGDDANDAAFRELLFEVNEDDRKILEEREDS